ncbi:MAG: WD40 repeat domain-containing protein, partial [Polyangiaceae bacterium]
WNTRTGENTKTLLGHTARINNLSFGPKGRKLLSVGRDRTVRLWNVKTGRQERAFSGHANSINEAVFSPDGKMVASASTDHTVRLWDAQTGRKLKRLTGHNGAVFGVGFSPDGRTLASVGFDKTLRLWDIETGAQREQHAFPARTYKVGFHPSGRWIAVATASSTFFLWDVANKRIAREYRGHSDEINDFGFSVDGKLVATVSDDTTSRLWHVETAKPVWRAPLLLSDPPRLYSHRGWRTIGASRPVAQAATAKWQLAVQKAARYAEMTPGGKMLCLQTYDDQLEIWSVDKDVLLRQEPFPGLLAMRAIKGGCLVRARAKDRGQVSVVEPTGQPKVLPIEGEPTAIGASDAHLFVAAGRQLVVFDRAGATKTHLITNLGITEIVRLDAWRLAVGYANGNIELLIVEMEQGTAEIAGALNEMFEQTPSSGVTRLLVGPNGTLVAGFANGVIGMWSWSNGKHLAEGRMHGPIEHLLIEKQKLFAASALGQSIAWDLRLLYVERCALLREVWAGVPVVWRDGRAVVEALPKDHPCAHDAPRQNSR